MMKTWHWAMPQIYRAKADFDRAADLCEHIPRGPHRNFVVSRFWSHISSSHLLSQLSRSTVNSDKDAARSLVRSLSHLEIGTPVNVSRWLEAVDRFRVLLQEVGADSNSWQIPKAVKASGSCFASAIANLNGTVWAEIKLDGERCGYLFDQKKKEKHDDWHAHQFSLHIHHHPMSPDWRSGCRSTSTRSKKKANRFRYSAKVIEIVLMIELLL